MAHFQLLEPLGRFTIPDRRKTYLHLVFLYYQNINL